MVAGPTGPMMVGPTGCIQMEESQADSTNSSGQRTGLQEVLRRERELANRVQVLLAERERRAKEVERRAEAARGEEEARAARAVHREEMERSLQEERRVELVTSRLAQGLRRELSEGLSARQQALLTAKRAGYEEAKRQTHRNLARIAQSKQHHLEVNLNSSRRVRLMHVHAKENLQQYWRERGQAIQESRLKDTELNARLTQRSLHNISLLQQKEQRLLLDIRQTLHLLPAIAPAQAP